MAKAKFVTVLTTALGLNNAKDPVRLIWDPKTGECELSQAVNVDIDVTGRISRRLGRTQKLTDSSRCGYSQGEVCLFVRGTDLCQLFPDYTVKGLRSNLTPGASMRYRTVAGRVYYLNGFERGYVQDGASFVWEKGSYAPPGDTHRVFSDPPIGHLISWFGGRMLIAKDNAVFASEPSFYGAFDLHTNFKLMSSRITMLQPTSQGLWVGTATETLFYRGTQWEKLRREVKANTGPLCGSDVVCSGDRLKLPGNVVLFTTPEGICTGSEDGTFANHTLYKLIFPSGKYASAAMVGDRYIILIEP